jgi:hypothetical protein
LRHHYGKTLNSFGLNRVSRQIGCIPAASTSPQYRFAENAWESSPHAWEKQLFCDLPHFPTASTGASFHVVESRKPRRGRAGANDPALERKMGCDHGRLPAAIMLAVGLVLAGEGALAQQRYDPGASDTEIKIGHIVPYSGLASPYSVIGKAEAAYFAKINAEGGVHRRMIRFLSYDDAYNPAKTVEQARRLVTRFCSSSTAWERRPILPSTNT